MVKHSLSQPESFIVKDITIENLKSYNFEADNSRPCQVVLFIPYVSVLQYNRR